MDARTYRPSGRFPSARCLRVPIKLRQAFKQRTQAAPEARATTRSQTQRRRDLPSIRWVWKVYNLQKLSFSTVTVAQMRQRAEHSTILADTGASVGSSYVWAPRIRCGNAAQRRPKKTLVGNFCVPRLTTPFPWLGIYRTNNSLDGSPGGRNASYRIDGHRLRRRAWDCGLGSGANRGAFRGPRSRRDGPEAIAKYQ